MNRCEKCNIVLPDLCGNCQAKASARHVCEWITSKNTGTFCKWCGITKPEKPVCAGCGKPYTDNHTNSVGWNQAEPHYCMDDSGKYKPEKPPMRPQEIGDD